MFLMNPCNANIKTWGYTEKIWQPLFYNNNWIAFMS